MKNKHLALGAVLLSGILWATIGLFNTYFGDLGIVNTDLVTIRLSMGTVLLFAYLLIRNPKALKIKMKDLWIFLGAGLTSIIMFQTCYMIAIRESGSYALAAVLLYTSPVFVMLFSTLFFKDKITPLKVIGAVLTVIGCALASGILQGTGTITATVLIAGLLSGIGYAMYSIFARVALNRGYNAITVTAWSFLSALIPLLVIADYGTIYQGIASAGWSGVGMWLLLGIVTEALPYALYTEGLTGMDTSKAAVTVAIEPIVAILIGVACGQTMHWTAWIGTVTVIVSILLLNLPKIRFGKKTEKA
ncbi:MAG: EamA family transporter [Clostridia bacterium]|nr:EamA family transporter [Clostridia bacterium]